MRKAVFYKGELSLFPAVDPLVQSFVFLVLFIFLFIQHYGSKFLTMVQRNRHVQKGANDAYICDIVNRDKLTEIREAIKALKGRSFANWLTIIGFLSTCFLINVANVLEAVIKRKDEMGQSCLTPCFIINRLEGIAYFLSNQDWIDTNLGVELIRLWLSFFPVFISIIDLNMMYSSFPPLSIFPLILCMPLYLSLDGFHKIKFAEFLVLFIIVSHWCLIAAAVYLCNGVYLW